MASVRPDLTVADLWRPSSWKHHYEYVVGLLHLCYNSQH